MLLDKIFKENIFRCFY